MTRGNDLDLYEREAESWWDPTSHAFRSLHAVNSFRLRLLAEWLGTQFTGRTVVDLGCGGGLLAKFFVDSGARVIGLDISPSSARVASKHVAPATFVCADVLRAPIQDGVADVVLLSDVVEHVTDPARAVAEAARILRPGGVCFVSTLNRTWKARVFGVWLAEGLGLVPCGTHDARLFVTPSELSTWAAGDGLHVERLQGESLAWAATIRRWTVTLQRSTDTRVTYCASFRKDLAHVQQKRATRIPTLARAGR